MKLTQECGLEDVRYMGSRYTWTNFQISGRRIWSKIDRVLANGSWLDTFEGAEANFEFVGELDHTPALLYFSTRQPKRRGIFRYYKMWKMHPRFFQIIEENWKDDDRGTVMFQIIQKLKRVQKGLNELNRREFSNIRERMEEAKSELEKAQSSLDEQPLDHLLQGKEKKCQDKYSKKQEFYGAKKEIRIPLCIILSSKSEGDLIRYYPSWILKGEESLRRLRFTDCLLSFMKNIWDFKKGIGER